MGGGLLVEENKREFSVLLRAACAVCVKKITGGRFVIRILIEFGLSGDESKIRLQQKKGNCSV